MKLISYRSERGARAAVMEADLIHAFDIGDLLQSRLGEASPYLITMQGIIEGGAEALEMIREALAQNSGTGAETTLERLVFSEIEVLAPLPRPIKMRCFSVYEKHMTQALDALLNAKGGSFLKWVNKFVPIIRIPKGFYHMPFYYKGNPLSVIGPGQNVIWPSFSEGKMDYELELGLVIGKTGKDVLEGEALKYVFGYTCFNDFSARDRLLLEMGKLKVGLLKSKDIDTGNATGPWIVTADEIPDPQNIAMRVYVNGQLRGESNTSEMYWTIQQQIAKASEGETLYPGEFIATGAASNGCGIESWTFLKVNDEVTLEIDGIGRLTNRLVAADGNKKREH